MLIYFAVFQGNGNRPVFTCHCYICKHAIQQRRPYFE